jgi:hypothetical protein
MSVTTIDALWFAAHPDRDYRLRHCTPAELASWPVPVKSGHTAFCIVRREDGARGQFAIESGAEKGLDCDFALHGLFEEVRGHWETEAPNE